jgi:hypothetical protein
MVDLKFQFHRLVRIHHPDVLRVKCEQEFIWAVIVDSFLPQHPNVDKLHERNLAFMVGQRKVVAHAG